jgi:hypothetical protein
LLYGFLDFFSRPHAESDFGFWSNEFMSFLDFHFRAACDSLTAQPPVAIPSPHAPVPSSAK